MSFCIRSPPTARRSPGRDTRRPRSRAVPGVGAEPTPARRRRLRAARQEPGIPGPGGATRRAGRIRRKHSSPPSPDSATVTWRRANWDTNRVGIWDSSANGSSQDARQVGDDGAGVGGGQAELGVLRPQVTGDPGGLGGLVIPALAEADGEGADRARDACACIKDTTRALSRPPDRKAPSGTSATMRSRTARRSRASSSTSSAGASDAAGLRCPSIATPASDHQGRTRAAQACGRAGGDVIRTQGQHRAWWQLWRRPRRCSGRPAPSRGAASAPALPLSTFA